MSHKIKSFKLYTKIISILYLQPTYYFNNILNVYVYTIFTANCYLKILLFQYTNIIKYHYKMLSGRIN